MTTEATRQTITAIIEQYSGDNTFWRFIDDFAATVDLDLKSSNIERIANLLGEGVRRYEWLREFEPFCQAQRDRSRKAEDVRCHRRLGNRRKPAGLSLFPFRQPRTFDVCRLCAVQAG
jgi:hypothetical protein